MLRLISTAFLEDIHNHSRLLKARFKIRKRELNLRRFEDKYHYNDKRNQYSGKQHGVLVETVPQVSYRITQYHSVFDHWLASVRGHPFQ